MQSDTAMRNNTTAGYPPILSKEKLAFYDCRFTIQTIVLLLHFIILNQVMINLRITGLYNRGQQDEYVELEAAARCDFEGLLKHMQEKGEIGTAKPSKKAKKNKKSK